MLRGTTPQPVTVHAGLTDGNVTEIVDGELQQGDQVVTDTITPDTPPATPLPGGGGGGQPALRRMF